MDQAKSYLEDYKLELSTGAASIVLGYASKKLLKKDILGISSVRAAAETFVAIVLAGIVVKEGIKPRLGPSIPKP